MKRILLECGGKSACILLDDVDLTDELFERLLFEGCTLHAGQACILNSRLLVPDNIHDEVVSRLAELARNVVVGNPSDAAVAMGPLISREHLSRVELFVEVFGHAIFLNAEADVPAMKLQIGFDDPVMAVMAFALKKECVGPRAPFLLSVNVAFGATNRFIDESDAA